MNTNIIYFSPTGTTAKITKEIANGLGGKKIEYNITLPQKRDEYRNLEFNEDELVIIGLPVYGGRIPAFLEDYLSSFKGNNTPAIITVVYGNRDYDDALLELKNIFEAGGFKSVAAGAFIGEHSFTDKLAKKRPDFNDKDIAFSFGTEIRSILDDQKKQQVPLTVKGNHPYKERRPKTPMAPVTNESCNDCGVCVENCPAGAIESAKVIDAEKCILCCSCIKKCPENAKSFTHEGFLAIQKMLIDNFASPRKEPELFTPKI